VTPTVTPIVFLGVATYPKIPRLAGSTGFILPSPDRLTQLPQFAPENNFPRYGIGDGAPPRQAKRTKGDVVKTKSRASLAG
jgi:hypothetical protein